MAVERADVEVLQIRRVRLQDDLELIIVLKPVRVLAVAPVLGTPRRLHIGRAPRAGTQRPQSRRRMEGARAHFHVVGLEDEAALFGPVALQGQDQPLEGPRRVHMRGSLVMSDPMAGNVPGTLGGVRERGDDSSFEPVIPRRRYARCPSLEESSADHFRRRGSLQPEPRPGGARFDRPEGFGRVEQALLAEGLAAEKAGEQGAARGREEADLHLVAEALAHHRSDVAQAVDEAEFEGFCADAERAREKLAILGLQLRDPRRLVTRSTKTSWMRR